MYDILAVFIFSILVCRFPGIACRSYLLCAFDNVFYVYVFECFLLVGLCKLLVKAVCKLACKQVLVAICIRSIASKGTQRVYLCFCTF